MSQGSTVTTTATSTGAAEGRGRSGGGLLAGPVGRNLGLVVALVLLCVVGVVTAGGPLPGARHTLSILRVADRERTRLNFRHSSV